MAIVNRPDLDPFQYRCKVCDSMFEAKGGNFSLCPRCYDDLEHNQERFNFRMRHSFDSSDWRGTFGTEGANDNPHNKPRSDDPNQSKAKVWGQLRETLIKLLLKLRILKR